MLLIPYHNSKIRSNLYNLLIFPLIALALGVKHAYDADHLVAVSNFLTHSKGIKETIRMTLSWAMGHMVTAAIVSVIFFSLATRAESLTRVLGHLELVVAVMLIAIGAFGILLELPTVQDLFRYHFRSEVHQNIHRRIFVGLGGYARGVHIHSPLLGVGIVHGIASNDELIVLLVAVLGVGSIEVLLGGIVVFTFGVVLGMTLYGVALTYPLFRFGARRARFTINVIVGLISIVYGLLIIAELGGFNPFDLLLSQ